nr:TadE/TadG family type IV pilus assembly protein [uncultured Massilia sp.]
MISRINRRRQSGATIVEMAIVAPVLLLVLLSLIELSLMFFSTLTMQYAVREGARYAVTGQSNLDPNAANQQRYAAVMQKIRNNSMGFYDKLAPTVSVNGTTYASSAYNNSMFGTAGSLVVLQLDCDWKVTTPLLAAFFANGKYHFAVAATMRNEFF